jgi:hypothetical protein
VAEGKSLRATRHTGTSPARRLRLHSTEMSRLQAKLLSVGCVSSLIAAMAAIDDSFRALLAGLGNIDLSTLSLSSTINVHHLSQTVTALIPIQLSGQGPLLFFALTGGALFVMMFRT